MHSLVATLLALLLLVAPPAARAAELLMFEEPGCIWCARWHSEIGTGYGRTDEGRTAPLRTIDLRRGLPRDIRFERPVTMTPTFVLVENGAELGRIVGYPGAHFFYPMLGELLRKLPAGPQPAGLPPQRDARHSDRSVKR